MAAKQKDETLAGQRRPVGPNKDKVIYPKANTEYDRDRTGQAQVIFVYPSDGIYGASKGGLQFGGHIKNPAVIANMQSKSKQPFQLVQRFVGGPEVKPVEPAEVKARREEEEARARKKA